jgi:hypothetical protein
MSIVFVLINFSGTSDMSADDAGWLITLIVAVVLIAIIVRASWRWR